MAIFSKSRELTASVEPSVKAAVGASSYSPLRSFISWTNGTRRARAMTLPVIVRGRDLICDTIAGLKLEMYREMWNGEEMEEVPLAPRSWLSRIDQSVPNQFIISWTIDDLIFEGRAFWLIESRSADGFPMSFTRLPAAMVQTLDQQGEVYFGPSKQVIFNGVQLDPRDLIQFISPMQSLNYDWGARCRDRASYRRIKAPSKLFSATFGIFAADWRRAFVVSRVERSCRAVQFGSHLWE
jgi:hypothetical protein